jgi:hypothetical protein
VGIWERPEVLQNRECRSRERGVSRQSLQYAGRILAARSSGVYRSVGMSFLKCQNVKTYQIPITPLRGVLNS